MAEDALQWHCHTQIRKYEAASTAVRDGTVEPYETLQVPNNLLTLRGSNNMWLGLFDGLSATTGLTNTFYDEANAVVMAGESTQTAASTDQDLAASSAATSRVIGSMTTGYPKVTIGGTLSTHSKMTFQSIFTTAQGNFAWNEWGIGNSTSSTVPFKGGLLNRKVESIGTKTASETWTIDVTLTLT